MAQKAYTAERERQKLLNSHSRKKDSVFEQQQQLLTNKNKRELRGQYRHFQSKKKGLMTENDADVAGSTAREKLVQ